MTSITQKKAPITICNESIKNVIGNVKEVVVYGFNHCKYIEACKYLNKIGFLCYNYKFNIDIYKEKKVYYLNDGSKVFSVGYNPTEKNYEGCNHKRVLTNVVLTNAGKIVHNKIFNTNRKPMQLVFFACKNNNLNCIHEPSYMLSKGVSYATHNEMRRAYKLTKHYNPVIAEAAKQTFKFVTIIDNGNDNYEIKEIKSPWECKGEEFFNKEFKRTRGHSPCKTNNCIKAYQWRKMADISITTYITSMFFKKTMANDLLSNKLKTYDVI